MKINFYIIIIFKNIRKHIEYNINCTVPWNIIFKKDALQINCSFYKDYTVLIQKFVCLRQTKDAAYQDR